MRTDSYPNSRKKLEALVGVAGVVVGFEAFRATFGDPFLNTSRNSPRGIAVRAAFFGVMLLSGYVASRLVRKFCRDESMEGVELTFDAVWWLFSVILAVMVIASIYIVVTSRNISFVPSALFISLLVIVVSPIDTNVSSRTFRLASFLAAMVSLCVFLWSREYLGLMAAGGIILLMFLPKGSRRRIWSVQ